MADIFREVDEELRRDRAHEIWRKYGGYVIAVGVLVVLVTVAIVGWREWRQTQLRAQGAELVAATELAARGQEQQAITALSEFSSKAADGYATLARLDEAALRAKQGDTAGAAAVYEKIAADTSVPALYRDIAVVMLAMNTIDTAEPSMTIARLAPITAPGNPMRFSALELTALAEKRAGNVTRAREIFEQLTGDAAAPGPLRERARELRQLLDTGGATGAG